MDRPLQGRKPQPGANASNHRKGGPRGDVMQNKSNGVVTPAAALIRHLATSNPWQKD